MNKYPVISLTLKECKKNTYEEFINDFKTVIVKLYSSYKYILESDKIDDYYKVYFKRCLNGEEKEQLHLSLYHLSYMLESYYNQKVIVLLDEYDAPIISSYLNGFYDKCISFMKSVFSSTFKTNLSLKKGVITGILRVSKEEMFSDANNIIIYNITDYKFREYFGFSEEEVKDVLEKYEISEKFKEVKKWYDGYNFCGLTIYNPWSILNFLNNPLHDLKPYWVNTGGVDLLKDLIYKTDNNTDIFVKYEELIASGEIDGVSLDLNMDLKWLETDTNTIWTLFMLAGYLTPKNFNPLLKGITLRIPNLEIKENLTSICIKWFKDSIKSGNKLVNYLYEHNMLSFKEEFKGIVEDSFSYYDLNKRYGESFYHAFAMGLLYSAADNFKIKSNRESGKGRYDLLLIPRKNNYAYIIEFKTAYDKTLDETLEDAFKQIDEMDYINEVKNYEVTKIAVAFRRKDVKINIR